MRPKRKSPGERKEKHQVGNLHSSPSTQKTVEWVVSSKLRTNTVSLHRIVTLEKTISEFDQAYFENLTQSLVAVSATHCGEPKRELTGTVPESRAKENYSPLWTDPPHGTRAVVSTHYVNELAALDLSIVHCIFRFVNRLSTISFPKDI